MRSKFTGLILTLAGVIVALSALDRFLASVESAEMEGTAQRSYVAGSRLLAAGKPAEAVDPLRNAHAVERENSTYELALITALIDSGKTADAEPLMTEMLEREPNDGNVNLIAARLDSREGKTAEAEAYYHRAIYGEWGDDPDKHRIAARLELIDQQNKQGRKQELLAELISLEAEPKADMAVRKRLASLFLQADSPSRAASVYGEMIAKDPKDVGAYEGLGEAELEQGRYNAARAAFLQASFHDPADVSIRSHLQMLNTVVGLDPTLRQLTSEEKYRRSLRILDMARAGLETCSPGNPLIASAASSISNKGLTPVNNEAAERVLTVAESLWRATNETCPTRSREEDALKLLMKKLTG